MLQVDVARALGRYENIDVTMMSMSGATGELAVGLRTGEVMIFRWCKNLDFGCEVPHKEAKGFGLESIIDRAEPGVKEGLLPLTLLEHRQSPVTALRISDVGFVCAGFEDGSIVVIDLRGPAVIFDTNIAELSGHNSKRGSLRRQGHAQAKPECAVTVEFAVMSLDGDGNTID